MNKVAVIGAGIIGLTSAVEIQKKLGNSVLVTIFTEKLSPNTTGDVSAGLWTPYLMQDTPEEDIKKWSQHTFEHFKNLWENGFAKTTGISLIQVYRLSTEENSPIPNWADIAFNFSQLSSKDVRRFGNGKFRSGVSYMAFTCEPTKYLPYLQNIFIQNGGTLKLRKITDFEELAKDFDVIVNCTGLYSQNLAQDPLVKPIRGQIARVEAPWIKFALFDEKNYIIPNTECVILGGTSQVDNYNLEVDEIDKEHILTGCYNLIPSLRHAPIIKHQVDLRPGRNSVRVELEIKKIGKKLIKIVHNYGHGGSGVTLGVGCAKNVADLIKTALENTKNKL